MLPCTPASPRCSTRLKDGEDHGGISTETVIVVAVLAVLAIAVGVIITNLVLDKANSIHL